MKIKICGITNKDDALNAIALNVDAIGFIFYANSPRSITKEKLEEFIIDIPPFVTTIGVFVNEDIDVIKETTERCQLNAIQLHGNESPKTCLSLQHQIIKAIPVKESNDLNKIPQYKGSANAILLDTKAENIHGGTGKTFDWGLAIEAKQFDTPLILSGGINEHNIEKAIKMVNPYAIHLSSGVEIEPGIKDYNKMNTIINLAKNI